MQQIYQWFHDYQQQVGMEYKLAEVQRVLHNDPRLDHLGKKSYTGKLESKGLVSSTLSLLPAVKE